MLRKFLTSLVLVVSVALAFSLPVRAQIIIIKEWNDTAGWQRGGASGPLPSAENTSDAPDRPRALKFSYPKGGCSPGAAHYAQIVTAPNIIYVGHWFKYSSNFKWHPIANKIDYLWVK